MFPHLKLYEGFINNNQLKKSQVTKAIKYILIIVPFFLLFPSLKVESQANFIFQRAHFFPTYQKIIGASLANQWAELWFISSLLIYLKWRWKHSTSFYPHHKHSVFFFGKFNDYTCAFRGESGAGNPIKTKSWP